MSELPTQKQESK